LNRIQFIFFAGSAQLQTSRIFGRGMMHHAPTTHIIATEQVGRKKMSLKQALKRFGVLALMIEGVVVAQLIPLALSILVMPHCRWPLQPRNS
jgi:hypothetical protein